MTAPTDAASLATLGLPPIDQVGFVVKSLADAEDRYTALFGPFTRMDGSVKDATYRGRSCDVALGILFSARGSCSGISNATMIRC